MSNIWISFYRHVTNDVWKKKEKKQQQTLTTLFSLLVLLSKHENIYLRPIFTGKKITTAFALPQMASPSHGSDEHVEMVVSSPRGDVTVQVFLECVFYTISELYDTRLDLLPDESDFPWTWTTVKRTLWAKIFQASNWRYRDCAFQKHANYEIQKPTDDYVFRCRQSSKRTS